MPTALLGVGKTNKKKARPCPKGFHDGLTNMQILLQGIAITAIIEAYYVAYTEALEQRSVNYGLQAKSLGSSESLISFKRNAFIPNILTTSSVYVILKLHPLFLIKEFF